jgi:hypothetical protein
MITDVYAYVFGIVVRTLWTNVEHSYLFLDLDPSKSMNIELSAKEHIKTLQARIKANIVADVGKVSVNFFSASLILLMQRRSSLSQTSSVPSSPSSLRRQRSRSSMLRRVSLRMVLQSSVRQTTCCRCLLVPLSSFLSVSFLSSRIK